MLAESTIRRKIHKAIRATAPEGGDKPTDFLVVAENWGVEYNFEEGKWDYDDSCGCRCPMGAVLIHHQPEPKKTKSGPSYDQATNAAKALGVTYNFIDAFVHAFDGGFVSPKSRNLGHKIGKSLRKYYIKKAD